MARLSPARATALALVSTCRRQKARMRDLARQDQRLAALSASDRALAFRLAMGVAGAAPMLDELVDGCLRRPSSLEPRVRDALRVAAYELCYLNTPAAAAVSQGVELVRSVAPRAAGLANAVLRRLDHDVRPQVGAAYEHLQAGQASVEELSLATCVPVWLVNKVCEQRGMAYARALCQAQLDAAPVFVAANGLKHTAADMERLLSARGMDPQPIEGLSGAFELGDGSRLAASGLVESVDLAVADRAAQLVCRIVAPAAPCDMLEVGQGRGTKSVLLMTALDTVHPTRIEAVDSVAYKVRLSRKRMKRAGLDGKVFSHEMDACQLSSTELPSSLSHGFAAVLIDAPCSGTGTLRRHPEIAANLMAGDVQELAQLQLAMLRAASARVAASGMLAYATCSVLREEDEDVVQAFLSCEEGRVFRAAPVSEAPACRADATLKQLVQAAQTPDGYFLTVPTLGGGDGHFCALLQRA